MVILSVVLALALSFGVWWGFLRPRSAHSAALDNGEQHVTVTVKGGYSPDHIEAKAGVPLRLTFDRQETGECSSEVVFSDFGVSKALPAYATTDVVLTPDKAGDYGFACGMNMLHGSLHIVENTTNIGGDADGDIERQQRGSVATLERPVPPAEAHPANTGPVDHPQDTDPVEHPRDTDLQDTAQASAEAEQRDVLTRFIVAAILTLPVFVGAMGHDMFHLGWLMWAANPWVQLVLTTPVMFWSGWPIHRVGWMSLVHRQPEMNALVTLGTCAAFAFSTVVTVFSSIIPVAFHAVYFETIGVIITLVMLGRYLEARARTTTGAAIRGLLALQPDIAHLEIEGRVTDVLVKQVKPGDGLLIKAGERIPIDGVISGGASSIDESMLSGEPLSVAKQTGDEVFAGTVNGNGVLHVEASGVGADTMLARIVDLVKTAQTTKAPVQRLADKIASYFVPIVLLIAIWTCVVWVAFGPSPALTHGVISAVTVLIIACPCALGLATPLSVMVATGKAAQVGVLVRSAEALEDSARIDTVIFDKTGTLTVGKPVVTDVRPAEHSAAAQYTREQLMTFAASLEAQSDHPLAQAVVDAARDQGFDLHANANVDTLPGLGLRGTVDGHEVLVGNTALLENVGVKVPTREQSNDNTVSNENSVSSENSVSEEAQGLIFVAIDQVFAGRIVVEDAVKPEAAAVVSTLQHAGIDVVMVTGDRVATARSVAASVGIRRVFAQVLPADKASVVGRLQTGKHTVAMVGDGINDAPALATAKLGIAMSTGTDVAIEAAGVTLVQGRLQGIPDALSIGRATMRNIRQNLGFAFVYNVLGIPLAAGVLYPIWGITLSPMIAGAAMAFSSLSVVLNANRLRGWKPAESIAVDLATHRSKAGGSIMQISSQEVDVEDMSTATPTSTHDHEHACACGHDHAAHGEHHHESQHHEHEHGADHACACGHGEGHGGKDHGGKDHSGKDHSGECGCGGHHDHHDVDHHGTDHHSARHQHDHEQSTITLTPSAATESAPDAHGQAPTMQSAAPSATTLTDPVCGMTVDPASAADTYEYEGTLYAFCSPGCAKAFKAMPGEFATQG